MASLRPVEPAQHTTKELGFQVHGIEGVSDFIVVGLDLCYKGSRVSILSCGLEQDSRHRRPGVENAPECSTGATYILGSLQGPCHLKP